MIRGEATNLRAIEFDDVELLYRWQNEPAVMEGWGRGVAVMSRSAVSRQVAGWIEDEERFERPVAFIVSTLEDRDIGLIVAMPVDAEARSLRLSLLIGHPDDWGQGYSADALDAYIEAAFDEWNAHRLWLEVEAGNERARRLYVHAGFTHEATLRNARFQHGSRHDVERFAITAERWRGEQGERLPVSKAQDPAEMFDVISADGQSAGRSKPRWQVHRDGDWHRSIHLWIYGVEGGEAYLDVQRRGLEKDTWPGRLDATVAGHLRAGEDIAEALREADEEVGLTISLADVVHVGTHLSVNEYDDGRRDREHQEILLARFNQPLSAYRPNIDEVDGIVRLRLDDVMALLTGAVNEATGQLLTAVDGSITDLAVKAEDFIPSVDRYTLRMAVAVRRAIAGDAPIVV